MSWTTVILVCAKLHNFCIDNNSPSPTSNTQKLASDYDYSQIVFGIDERNSIIILLVCLERKGDILQNICQIKDGLDPDRLKATLMLNFFLKDYINFENKHICVDKEL